MNELIDFLDDILIEFDEMGFVPTNHPHDHNSEYYAIDWKNRLINALAGYRKQSEWINVEDRLPDNGMERVLVFLADDWFTKPIGENKIDTDRVVDGKWVRWSNHVTHWMPLPEAPEMKGGAE